MNECETNTLPPPLDTAQSTNESTLQGFLVVDRTHYSFLRRDGEFSRLGETVKSSPIVFQFYDEALNALIDQTIKHPELRAEVMEVPLSQRQKVQWPDDWLVARDKVQMEMAHLKQELGGHDLEASLESIGVMDERSLDIADAEVE